jgi:hypothetical protein
LIVAHYEVVGRVFSKATRPGGTIDWLLALARRYASYGLRVRSSLRDGAIFDAFSHHFVVGSIKCPSGTDSLAPTRRSDLIATF